MEFQNSYSVLSEGEPAIQIDKSYSENGDDETPQKTHLDTELSKLTLKPRVLNPRASNFLGSIRNPTVRQAVTRLLDLQAQKQRDNEAYQAELRALEEKYLSKAKPLYEQRAAILSGQDLSCDLTMKGFSGPPAAIPEFWLRVMQNHPSVDSLIQEWDEEALVYLVDVQLILPEAPRLGFVLKFRFAENPFFENRTLCKEYTYERGENGALFYGDVFGSSIRWKEGRALPPQQYESSDGPSDEEPLESFFDFFNPPRLTPASSEELDILEMKLALDYGYGEIFKEKLIPDAVDWLIGEAEC